MAVINATKTGNWSDATVWPGSVYPTSVDDVFANTYTITIDQNINVLSINTTAGSGGAAGGGFQMNTPYLITANIVAGTTACLNLSTTTGTVTIVGGISGGSSANARGLLMSGDVNVNNTGNLRGGTASTTHAIDHASTGALSANGIILGGATSSGNSYAIRLYANGELDVLGGTIIGGGANGNAINIESTTSKNHYVKCSQIIGAANASSSGISYAGTGIMDVYADIIGGAFASGNSFGIINNNTCTLNIIGNLSGGTVNQFNDAVRLQTNLCNLSISGICTSRTSPALNNNGTTSIISITGECFVGNSNAITNNGGGSSILRLYGNVNSGASIGFVNGAGSSIIYGNITGGTGTNHYGASNGTGILTVFGTVSGGTGSDSLGIINSNTGTTYIFGNVYAGRNGRSYGVGNSFTGAVYISGGVFGGSATEAYGVRNASTGIIEVSGFAVGGTTNGAIGFYNFSTGRMTLYGDVSGSSTINCHGAYNNGTGTMYIFGTAYAGDNSNGAFNNSTGILYCKKVVGNRAGAGIAGVAQGAGIFSNNIGSISVIEEMQFGPNGMSPIQGNVFFANRINNQCTAYLSGGGFKTLTDPSSGTDYPNENNVRQGTVYAFNNRTGTLIVPSVSSVALNVPVDNTVGTAVLTQEAIWNTSNNTLTANSLSATIGYKLNNVATTQTVGSLIAAYNT